MLAAILNLNENDMIDNSDKKNIDDLIENFYDKLKLQVKDVQVMLVPDSCDLNEYLVINSNKSYHLLYPVSTENTLYLSIDPKFKKLPKLKIDAKCPSIRLRFSNNKIIKLAEFLQKLPLPEMPKSSSTTTITSSNKSTAPITKMKQQASIVEETTKITTSTNEIDNEWDGPFYTPRDPKEMNGPPIPNYTHILVNFKMDGFHIDLNNNEASRDLEQDYLSLILWY